MRIAARLPKAIAATLRKFRDLLSFIQSLSLAQGNKNRSIISLEFLWFLRFGKTGKTIARLCRLYACLMARER
jgi:hypothetical protein